MSFNTPPTGFTHTWLWLGGLLFTCTALYWPALHGPFLFDDFPNLSALTSIAHVASWRDLGVYLSQPRQFPGRPLAMLSFLLQRGDWPSSPFPFKLANLGLHLGCGSLIFMLTRRLSQLMGSDGNPPPRSGQHELAALLATAAWLLNPMELSGVVLVVQRMTLLMTLFVLLGLLAYLRGVLRQDLSVFQRGAWMLMGLGLCAALSTLSKENGILLPVYALVLDASVLRAFTSQLPKSLQWLRRLLIWPTALFVLAYLAYAAFIALNGQHGRDFTLGERLLTESRVLSSYLANTFFPRFGVYGLYHDNFAVSHDLVSPPGTAFCMVALTAAVTIGFASMKRHPLLAMGILWYFAGQLIESSTVMLELYFEHRNYVPLIGVMMAIGIGITRLSMPTWRKFAHLAYGTWLVASCLATALSARVYASENLLATAWAQEQPDSARAQSYLADRLAQNGRLDEALSVVAASQARLPRNAGLEANRIYLLCKMGKLNARDLDHLDLVLRTASFDRGVSENMDTLRRLAIDKRCPALDDTRWMSSIDILLGNIAYRNNTVSNGFLHYQRHLWAVQHGDLDMAIGELDAVYQVDPDANIPRLQAQYLVAAGLRTQAIDVLRRTDTRRLPLLRRLLVDDKAVNEETIAEIERMQ